MTITIEIHAPGHPAPREMLGPVVIVMESGAAAAQNQTDRSESSAGRDTMYPCA